VSQTARGPVTFPSGGRAIDQNGDGVIEVREGIRAATPHSVIVDSDGFRQTVADLMQLMRVIEGGVDVDGDALRDLNPSRIYYFGQSLGGRYGTDFLAVEPDVRAGVLSVPGGPRTSACSIASATASLRQLPGEPNAVAGQRAGSHSHRGSSHSRSATIQ
jgi:poly(3-hydroxybutyrate) depolymerase